MADPDRVLVPTMGRPREDEALAYALESFPEATVTVLAVVTPLDAPLSEGGILERDEERLAAARDRAETIRETACEAVGASREWVRIETVEGRPGDAVPAYATDAAIDHVVLYGHESTGFVRRFLGRGVATTVVDRTPVPVTVLDPDESAADVD